VVRRIFAEFLAGFGIYAIAERLTAEGIACPSAHDPDRNRHRCGIAWNKYAIRAILTNPRYTGRQVWKRQRKDEVLLNVHDIALGHTTKMRWNDQDKWIYSEQVVHPLIIDEDTFGRAQDLLTARRGTRGPHKPHKSRHAYALRGLLFCGVCDRRMQGHWANQAPYYRCRFPAEYALANRLTHPLNVTLRQDALLGPLDEWLASKFDPRNLPVTIDELLAAAAISQTVPHAAEDEINAQIAQCDRKLDQYRATLDAGADPATVARWITETEAERAKYQALKRAASPQAQSMSRDEIASVVSALSDLLRVLRSADPADKAEIYAQLGLRLTYRPDEDPAIRAEVRIVPAQHWQFEGVRGGT
jgi:site-specific DNA recombinase